MYEAFSHHVGTFLFFFFLELAFVIGTLYCMCRWYIHKFMRRMKPNNVCNLIGNYLITFLYWAKNPGPTVLEMILSEASQSSHLFDLLILILLQHCRLHDRLHSAHVWIVGRIWAWVGNFHTWAIMIFYKTIL